MFPAHGPGIAPESADGILPVAAGLEADGNAAILERREVSTRLALEAAAKVGEIAPEGREVDVPPRPAVTRMEHTLHDAGHQPRVMNGGPQHLGAALLLFVRFLMTYVLIGD